MLSILRTFTGIYASKLGLPMVETVLHAVVWKVSFVSFCSNKNFFIYEEHLELLRRHIEGL